LASCPIVEIAAGEIVHSPGTRNHDVRLIVGGSAEETDPASGTTRRLGVGALAGGYSLQDLPARDLLCRARSAVTVVSVPAATYRAFISRSGGAGACREPAGFLDVVSICPAFSGISTAGVLNRVAAAMEERHLPRGSVASAEPRPALCVLASGEVDIAVGSQLIEALHPGGFWGEERIVSAAPGLSVARAVTDCRYLVVPSEILADIPIVQWELLEAFERRLRSFRSGFRFEWSESFRVEVAALDEQHRTLFGLVNALSQAIGDAGKVEGHDAEKRKILEFARKHFADEEALMRAHSYPGSETQKKAHESLLGQLERLVSAQERRARPRSETPIDYLKDWLITHTLLEDLQYKEFFAQRGIR
jgi:hemerythrin-like metal-binding protein